MKIKWGALVVDGRGKIGGHVASKNRSGAYLRTKVTPDNPQTARQMHRRSQLAQLSSEWGELTEAQRNAWIGAVDGFPKNDVFGDSVKPSGKNLFVGLNLNLLHIMQATIQVPPTPGEVVELAPFDVGISSGGQLTVDISEVTENPFKVFATPKLRKGVNFVKNKFRMIGMIEEGQSNEVDLDDMYKDRFGDIETGDKIAVKFIPVNSTTGQRGPGSSWLGVLETLS